MSNIPIRDLTQTGTPNASDQIVFDNGVMRRGTVGSMADAVRPVASLSEAQAGVDNAKTMTPLRVKDSIASEIGVTLASKAQGDLANGAVQTSSLGAGVATALGVNVASPGAVVVNGGALGTPASATLTNATGLPVGTGVSGLGTNVATFLATPSSANLRAALTDEVGTGSAYFVGGALGTPASATLTNATGLPLSGLTAQAAYSLVGNFTGSTAVPTAATMASLAAKASPAGTDEVLIADNAASGQFKRSPVSALGGGGSGVTTLNGQTGGLQNYFAPQGRLTLSPTTGGVPVPFMTTSVAAATSIIYTNYTGPFVPIYDGTNFIPTIFPEVSQATTDTTKSPAAVAANSVYDLFCWMDGATPRCTRGPAWTNDTTRSAGTALVWVNGLPLNSASITNGPAAQRGTWVGTVRSNASSSIDFILGSLAAGGGAATIGVWNAYNREEVKTMVRDSGSSWTNTTSGWRAANNSTTARVSAVRGLDVDFVSAEYKAQGTPGAATVISAGVGLDATNAITGTAASSSLTTNGLQVTGAFSGLMGLGYHYLAPLEYNSTTTSSTWIGNSGTSFVQSGFHASLKY